MSQRRTHAQVAHDARMAERRDVIALIRSMEESTRSMAQRGSFSDAEGQHIVGILSGLVGTIDAGCHVRESGDT